MNNINVKILVINIIIIINITNNTIIINIKLDGLNVLDLYSDDTTYMGFQKNFVNLIWYKRRLQLSADTNKKEVC